VPINHHEEPAGDPAPHHAHPSRWRRDGRRVRHPSPQSSQATQAKVEPRATSKKTSTADIALIGDTRYTPEQRDKFPNLMEEINDERVAFTIHAGDIKGGSDPCDDEVYQETKELFDEFERPLIYTPGDNEWTDCHRAGGDPLERLGFLRETFYPDDQSLGERPLRLDRQSEEYPENVRWEFGDVTFATLHVVGSNDNLPDAANPVGDAAEHAARTEANLAWLAETFDAAEKDDSVGVLITMQANPGFELPPEERTGFNELLAALEAETLAFEKPVILVHGDSHYFRIDKPMVASTSGRRVESFTRVETFGTDDVH
jgi:hypothetical protein